MGDAPLDLPVNLAKVEAEEPHVLPAQGELFPLDREPGGEEHLLDGHQDIAWGIGNQVAVAAGASILKSSSRSTIWAPL
jgi:hypothetical protein